MGAVKTNMIHFDGQTLRGFGVTIPATCIVRNDLNGRRGSNEVLYADHGHVRTDGIGRPYQPRPFPAGQWEIHTIRWDPPSSIYWPVFLATQAWQRLPYWSITEDGFYNKPTGGFFKGYGYGIHHARLKNGGHPIASSTTLGCINILSPDDAEWLGNCITNAMNSKETTIIDVPKHSEWVR